MLTKDGKKELSKLAKSHVDASDLNGGGLGETGTGFD